MRYIIYILILLQISSCDDTLFNEGDITTKEIIVNDFDEIYVEDIFDIYLIQDTVCSIKAKGGSNLISNLTFKVDDDKILSIDNNNSNRWSRSYDKIELYISVDTLWFLRLNAPSRVVSLDTLVTPELKIFSITDFAEYDINLDCNNCYIVNTSTSGGVVNLTGKAVTFSFRARGSFQINAQDFTADHVTVTSETIGDCSIFANNSVEAEILHSGNVYYKGTPETVTFINDKARQQLIKTD